MPKSVSILLGVGLLVSLLAVPSGGALLPVSATFQVSLPPPFPPVPVTGSGVGTSVGGGVATIPAGLFAGNPNIVVPLTSTVGGVYQLTVPANSVNNPAGSFAPNGAMALAGAVYFNGGGPAGIPFFPIGGGGTAMGPGLGSIPQTVIGATWMGGNHVFTAMGAALANAISVSATAYDNRTAGGLGTLQLVAPSSFKLSGGSLGQIPFFGILTLTYTPEPGTLTLFGVGILGFALRGRVKVRGGAATPSTT